MGDRKGGKGKGGKRTGNTPPSSPRTGERNTDPAKGGSKVFPDPKQKGAFFTYKGKKSVYFCKAFMKDPKNCTKGKDCKFPHRTKQEVTDMNAKLNA